MHAIPMRVLALTFAALIGGTGCASAPEGGAASVEPTEPAPAAGPEHALLEEIFWTCDYVATTRGMDATPIVQCATATRELRQVKFAGSFPRMLAWWREHKLAEHERRRAQRAAPGL